MKLSQSVVLTYAVYVLYLLTLLVCTECEVGELLNVVGGRAGILRAGAPLPARRVRLLQADP